MHKYLLIVDYIAKYLIELSIDYVLKKMNIHTNSIDDNGLGNKYTKSIYCDHENNIWVGTYGTGIVQLTDNCFTFYPSPSASITAFRTATKSMRAIRRATRAGALTAAALFPCSTK